MSTAMGSFTDQSSNFDNVVVATKAWNLLYSVVDWAPGHEEGSSPRGARADVHRVT